MQTPDRSDAQRFLEELRAQFASLASTFDSGSWDAPTVLERLGRIREARENAELIGFQQLAETIAEIVEACEACSEPEALHPNSVSVVVDAITGAETIVEAMSLGDLSRSLRPETVEALRSLRRPLREPEDTAPSADETPQFRFRRTDVSSGASSPENTGGTALTDASASAGERDGDEPSGPPGHESALADFDTDPTLDVSGETEASGEQEGSDEDRVIARDAGDDAAADSAWTAEGGVASTGMPTDGAPGDASANATSWAAPVDEEPANPTGDDAPDAVVNPADEAGVLEEGVASEVSPPTDSLPDSPADTADPAWAPTGSAEDSPAMEDEAGVLGVTEDPFVEHASGAENDGTAEIGGATDAPEASDSGRVVDGTPEDEADPGTIASDGSLTNQGVIEDDPADGVEASIVPPASAPVADEPVCDEADDVSVSEGPGGVPVAFEDEHHGSADAASEADEVSTVDGEEDSIEEAPAVEAEHGAAVGTVDDADAASHAIEDQTDGASDDIAGPASSTDAFEPAGNASVEPGDGAFEEAEPAEAVFSEAETAAVESRDADPDGPELAGDLTAGAAGIDAADDGSFADGAAGIDPGADSAEVEGTDGGEAPFASLPSWPDFDGEPADGDHAEGVVTDDALGFSEADETLGLDGDETPVSVGSETAIAPAGDHTETATDGSDDDAETGALAAAANGFAGDDADAGTPDDASVHDGIDEPVDEGEAGPLAAAVNGFAENNTAADASEGASVQDGTEEAIEEGGPGALVAAANGFAGASGFEDGSAEAGSTPVDAVNADEPGSLSSPPSFGQQTGGTPDAAASMPDPNTPLDPTGGMPDPNTPLDPTGGMPDPNTPLDPTGGMTDPNTPLDPTGGMPDPNTPLDPTGGMPDPNMSLDPTGGMPDPNTPLDPTGGMPDPNTPLDPTGGMPDPNTPLDPTGGMPDPNTPLDPTGGAMVGAAGAADDDETESWGSTPIIIDPDRAELLQFMVTDVRTSATELEPILAEAYEFTSRQEAADRVVELANEMGKISEFFEFRSFETIIGIMREIGESLGSVGDAQLDEICIRLRALGSLLDQYCSGLEVGMELTWPFKTFRRRVGLLLAGQNLHPDLVAWHRGDPERVLELDRIVDGVEELPNPPSEVADGSAPAAAPSSAGGASQSAETKPADSKVPSVRVTQDSIEELFDIVRQLVLNKNQIESLAFDARVSGLSREKAEPLSLRAAEFSRLVERLQVSLSKTCVQPISVVLDRYERMVRDVAQLKEKAVDLEIVGAETRIDKFLLDQIADPIGRLLRDIASRSIETTAEREAAGKARSGRIRVEAADHESHITIDITHDGAAPDPAKILEEARALGTAPENLDELSPQEILLLPFRQWFETSETAGVAEAFAGHGGSVGVRTSDGETTYQIVLPVSGAVLGVMNVQVGSGIYAIPVRSIVEIISLNESTLQSVKGSPVLRVRDRVYPVITSAERFDESGESKAGVAVIVSSDKRSVALSVDRVIGHQEIVIEPIGLDRQQLGPFLGGAIRSDGSICLVVDVRRLIESDPRQVTEAAGELAGA